MAKVDPHPAVGFLRGRIGGLIYSRYSDDRIVVRREAAHRPSMTPRQIAAQAEFRKAVTYSKNALADPQCVARYLAVANARRKRACDLAVADFLRAPSIAEIDFRAYGGRQGEAISVVVMDDFQVARVQVAIRDVTGQTLEAGAAVLESVHAPSRWVYTAQAMVPPGQTIICEVTAADWPGNTVLKAAHHFLAQPT